jgi:hypothetical protein
MGNMAEEDKPERALGLSPAQVLGSALAAVSSAVVASTAGTTGTLIGAAVGSVIATVGAAIYTWWLRRTHETAKKVAAKARQAALATQPLPRTVAQGPLRSRKERAAAARDAAGEKPREGAGDEAGEQAGATADGPDPGPDGETFVHSLRRMPWRKVALATALVAVITLATLTLVEGLAGKPVSSITGGSDAEGTSVGHVVGSDDEPEKPADDESPVPEEPTSEPTTPEESVEPVPSPSAPSEPEPSDATEVPQTPEDTATADEPTQP